MADGVLSFPPPVFELGGERRWLIDARNEIGINLIGSWEMTSLPSRHGNRFWIGNVELHEDETLRSQQRQPA